MNCNLVVPGGAFSPLGYGYTLSFVSENLTGTRVEHGKTPPRSTGECHCLLVEMKVKGCMLRIVRIGAMIDGEATGDEEKDEEMTDGDDRERERETNTNTRCTYIVVVLIAWFGITPMSE